MSFGRSRQARLHAPSALIAAAIALAGSPAGAQTLPASPEKQVVANPRQFHGKRVRIDGIACVDPGKSGFKCLKRVGGQLLLVDGLVMGPDTPLSVAEILNGDCKGTANLSSQACIMSVEFEPSSSIREMIETENGSIQRVTLSTGQIEFYRPRTKR